VQASSAAGKSSVQDTVLSLIPDSDRYDLAAVSSRALFYVEGDALRHKALSIAEEEGAQGASYSLKLMQSAGKLSIAVPVKDPETGEMTTKTRTVDGPVALFMTTTAAEVNDELQNRFLVLTVDESAAQTAAVQAAQRTRETRAGYAAARRAAAVRHLHHDAQHLLNPAVRVFNPYAPRLTFASGRTRTRRDHAKYLRLIRVLTFLRQHQRERRTEVIEGARVVFIESTLEDIADANRIAAAILGRSLDELAPQTRRLLEALRELVRAKATLTARPVSDVRVTRREIREHTGWTYRQVHIHLTRLTDLEYVHVHKGATTCSQLYALNWDGSGSDGSHFVLGLSDPAESTGTTPKLTGPEGEVYRSDGEVDRRFTAVLPPFYRRFTGGGIADIRREIATFRIDWRLALQKTLIRSAPPGLGVVPYLYAADERAAPGVAS